VTNEPHVEAVPGKHARTLRAARRYGPWIVSAVVVVALLGRYDVEEIVKAMRAGNAWPLFPIAFAFSVGQILLVARWDTFILRCVLPALRYLDVARVKAGCATLQAVAYAANVGVFGAWIARATGVGVRNAIGLVTFGTFSDLAAGSIVITLSVQLGHAPVHAFFRWVPPILAIVALVVLLAAERRPLDPHVEASILRVFRSVRRGPAIAGIVGRMSSALFLGVATWLAARGFGLQIPVGVMIVYVPIVMVVGSLPINIGSFGAVQGAWLLFLPWSTGPQILAFQFLWGVALMASQVLRGLPFIRRVLAEVAEGSAVPAKPE
jgi:hypothetical protein